MMDSLDYFLSLPYLDLRLPHRFLRNTYAARLISKARNKVPRLLVKRQADTLSAAALLFEHHLCGVALGIYMPINGEVYRTLVAPADEMATVAREVGEYLVRNGALIALVSYLDEACGVVETQDGFWDAEHLVATDQRDTSCRLPLQTTFDETLATMGQHTRRNLRAFQRRVVSEFGAAYASRAEVSLNDFLELNAKSKYAVTEWMARWRYDSVHRVSGGTISGLRAADGRWLSLLGSHLQGETVWLDWQMNREIEGSVSLVSAMCAFFIAAQIELGMKWIHFEGGSPHPMKHAFVKEQARDLLFAKKILSPDLLKRIATGISSTGPLATFLCAESLVWRG